MEHTGKGARPEPVTRLDQMKSEQREPIYPANDAPHLTDWLFEIGPTAGDGPLGWQDITAWSSQVGIELDPWEARTLRRLSKAFFNQRYDARKPNCPEPRVQAEETEIRNRVADQFAAMLSAFRGAPE